MNSMSIRRYGFLPVVACLALTLSPAVAQQNSTVIGPTNTDLSDGASALFAGDAEEGVRLTLRGLKHENSTRNRLTGMTNLCAGYRSPRTGARPRAARAAHGAPGACARPPARRRQQRLFACSFFSRAAPLTWTHHAEPSITNIYIIDKFYL